MSYMIYGKPSCPYCERAKSLLHGLGLDYTYVDLSQDLSKLEEFKQQGFRTVPIIYHGDTLVGGYAQLEEYLLDSVD